MRQIGTLLIEQMQTYPKSEDEHYEVLEGEYPVYEVSKDGIAGYMVTVDVIKIPSNLPGQLVLGGGWYSRSPYEIPSFGLGRFVSCVEDLPRVGWLGTQLVCKLNDLQ